MYLFLPVLVANNKAKLKTRSGLRFENPSSILERGEPRRSAVLVSEKRRPVYTEQ